MDEILNEINQKNTQYLKAAINRAKFRLAGHEDVRGQLKEILIGINERVNREQLDLGGIYELEFLDGLIRIYSSGILDEGLPLLSCGGKERIYAPQDPGLGAGSCPAAGEAAEAYRKNGKSVKRGKDRKVCG